MKLSLGCALRCSLAVFVASCGEGPNSGADAGSQAGDAPVPSVLPGDGPVPFYALRLVNPRAYTVIVFASAGAREVLLDTVPSGDSIEVNVQVDAEVLKLRALDLDGNELGEDFISLGEDESGRALGGGSGAPGDTLPAGFDDTLEDEPAGAPPDSVTSLRWELPRSR